MVSHNSYETCRRWSVSSTSSWYVLAPLFWLPFIFKINLIPSKNCFTLLLVFFFILRPEDDDKNHSLFSVTYSFSLWNIVVFSLFFRYQLFALPGVWIHQPNIYTTVRLKASGSGRLRRRQSPVRSYVSCSLVDINTRIFCVVVTSDFCRPSRLTSCLFWVAVHHVMM